MKNITNHEEIIVGIDEAGRGPVIGPLVICAYAISRKDIDKLTKLKVKDSKLLSKKRRDELYSQLIPIAADYKVKHLSAAEIDELRKNYTLNIIEQRIMLKLAKDLKTTPSEIYIDAADVNEKRFGGVFETEFSDAKIISKHKADMLFPVVSAASIIAKKERDDAIEKISNKIGEEIGSGYPADPITREFLRRYYAKNKKFPAYVRESWDTVNKIKKEFSEKKKLSEYF